MRKNVASQVVGAQMITASDGSVFTGSVTVYVTGNGGTQAVGSVGSGACTHEGQGFHTYAPAQAETNYDHVAFTFIGSGAVAATVQVYPSFPQTGDAFARVGAPVGASISADIAALQADTDNLQTRIPAALVSGRMDASVGAMATDVLTATALDATAVTEIQSGLSTLTAAGIRSATGLASANLDTQLSTIAGYIDTEVAAILAAVDTEVAAIKAKTDNLPAAPAAVSDVPSAATIASTVWNEAISGHLTAGSTGAALNAAGSAGDPWTTPLPGAYGAGTAGYIIGTNINATISSRQATHDATERNAIADALLKRDWTAVSGEAARSMLNAGRFLRNKWSISGTTLTVTKEDDATTAWSATVTAAPGADPISGSDPA